MKCEQCKKVFDSKKKLETHQSKNPNCIHKCFCCMKLFASKQSLQKHAMIQCEQKYECEKCHKVYSSKYTRNYHNCQANKKCCPVFITDTSTFTIFYSTSGKYSR